MKKSIVEREFELLVDRLDAAFTRLIIQRVNHPDIRETARVVATSIDRLVRAHAIELSFPLPRATDKLLATFEDDLRRKREHFPACEPCAGHGSIKTTCGTCDGERHPIAVCADCGDAPVYRECSACGGDGVRDVW